MRLKSVIPALKTRSSSTYFANWHKIALVFADTAGKWPYAEDLTSDFVYARLHGDEELYASGYTEPALDRLAERFKAWSGGKQPTDARLWSSKKPPRAKQRDIFVYFDNDVKVRAPFDAMSLADRLGPGARRSGSERESRNAGGIGESSCE